MTDENAAYKLARDDLKSGRPLLRGSLTMA
jgi:hypothetical protein